MAGEIMTPRTEITALRIESSIIDARDLIVDQKYSRLPVYRDTIDNIEGMIYVRDLLQAWAEGKENQPLTDVLRDAFFVPETKTAAELLKTMQANHVQIAIVIDEYGGVAGLVTIEDVLEEIVGDIEDETDAQADRFIHKIDSHDFLVKALTPIDEFNAYFNSSFSEEEFDTIGGLVIQAFGHMPTRNEITTIDDFKFEVVNADQRKIYSLRMCPPR
jgi:magnesium and cobalt transporter